MSGSRKQRAEINPEDDVFEIIGIPGNNFVTPQVKFSKLRYGSNKQILFNTEAQVFLYKS